MTQAEPQVEVSLSRNLGLLAVTMIGVGAMIGAGIFVLTGIAAGKAGPGLLLAFLLNGCIALIIGGSYAELGSCFPAAGGGYLWIKQGMNDLFGYLSGWMSWFAQSLACALYALAFGAFFTELLGLWGLDLAADCADIHHGCPLLHWSRVGLGVALAATFTWINYKGSSETGLIGNIVTSIKIVILVVMAAFGLSLMFREAGGSVSTIVESSFRPFLPFGIGGVLLAMGLTFIAFEGFEIIAASGEEVKNPTRNIPLAIALSILIAVSIYLMTAAVVIGAIDSGDPSVPVYQFLSTLGELGMVEVAAQIFPDGGKLMLILAGLASATSALNATLYGSSRVAFAMGRDGNLFPAFGQINPSTMTPVMAIAMSGLLVVAMAVSLPIEDVAASANIMFLLLFMMVCYSVVSLRKSRPDLKRRFTLPLTPFLPSLGIAICLVLAVWLASLSMIAWGIAIAWMVSGLTIYFVWILPNQTKWEVDPSRTVSESASVLTATGLPTVLVPVKDKFMASSVGALGSIFAHQRGHELLCMHVVRTPDMNTVRADMIDTSVTRVATRVARQLDVNHRELTVIGRSVSQTISAKAHEYDTELIVFGWPGATVGSQHAFGSVIDLIGTNPPCDILVTHFNTLWRKPRRIVIPSRGRGANLRMSYEITRNLVAFYRSEDSSKTTGSHSASDEEIQIRTIYVVTSDEEREHTPLVKQTSIDLAKSVDVDTEFEVVEAVNVEAGILQASRNADLLLLGASDEGYFTQQFRGSIPERVMRKTSANVIMSRKFQGPVSSMLRRFGLGGPREDQDVPNFDSE